MPPEVRSLRGWGGPGITGIAMVEWNIQSRAHACHACGGSFGDQQPYHTLLLDARGNYDRQDVCETCWVAEYARGAAERSGFVSHWQGVYEAPTARPEAIQKETAETLLRKLVERQDPADVGATFILAVMLERKRILKVKDQVRLEGRRVFVYEQPRTGDMFTIVDPDLHLDQLEEVQRHVGHLLEHGLDAPEGTPVVSVVTPDASATIDHGSAEERAMDSAGEPETSPVPAVP
jgi:hypothetical protein